MSERWAASISNLDCMKRPIFDPRDLPVRVLPIHVEFCLILRSILAKTKSINQGTKVLKVKGQNSRVFAFCLPFI